MLSLSNFERDASKFINNELSGLPHAEFIKRNASYKYVDKQNSSIELNTFGLDEIPESTIALLKNSMKDYKALVSTELVVNQNISKGLDNYRYMEELRTRDSLDLLSQTQQIKYLENQVNRLARLERDLIPFAELTKEIEVNYETIEQLSYSKIINSNFKKFDTLTVFSVKWVDSLTNEKSRLKDRDKLEKWLKLKLDLDTLVVKRVN